MRIVSNTLAFHKVIAGLLSAAIMVGAGDALAQTISTEFATESSDEVSLMNHLNDGLRQYACKNLTPEERLTLQVCDVKVVKVRGNKITITFRTTKSATYVIGYSEALEDGSINYFNGVFEGGPAKSSILHRQTIEFPVTEPTKYHLTIQAATPVVEGVPTEFDDFGSNWASPNATEVFAVWTKRVRR